MFCSPHPFIGKGPDSAAKSGPARQSRIRERHSMQFSSSLKQNHLFRRLYRRGASAADRNLVLYCRKNGSQANRVGLTVGAKLAHAVQRNRLRRQLREIYRLHESELRRGMDIVVVARVKSRYVGYAELEKAFLSACTRLGMLSETVKSGEKT